MYYTNTEVSFKPNIHRICPILITTIIHFKIGEEAAQFILDLPSDSNMSDLDELSVDEDLNDFSEDENTNVCNEDPKHHLT